MLGLPAVACLLSLGLHTPLKAESARDTASLSADYASIELSIARNKVDDQTFKRIEALLKADPTNSYTHLLLARCLEIKGLLDLSEEQFQLAAHYGNHLDLLLKRMANAITQGDMDEAQKICHLLERRFPDDAAVQFLHAVALQQGGDPGCAEPVYERLLKNGCKQCGVASALGAIRLNQDRFLEALALADMDLKLNVDYFAAHIVKGNALASLGRVDEALKSLLKVFAYNPFQSSVTPRLAQLLYQRGEYRQALQPAMYSLMMARNEQIYNQYAALLRRLISLTSDAEGAEAAAAVGGKEDRRANAWQFHYSLGKIYEESRKPAQALEQYVTALKMNPKYPAALYRVGRIIEHRYGDYVTAMRYYQQADQMSREAKDVMPDRRATDAFIRLAGRLQNRPRDLSWRLKDWLGKTFGGQRSS